MTLTYQPFKNVYPLLYFANVCHVLLEKVFKKYKNNLVRSQIWIKYSLFSILLGKLGEINQKSVAV